MNARTSSSIPSGSAEDISGPLLIELDGGLLRSDLASELYWARRAARWAHLLSDEQEGPATGGSSDVSLCPLNDGVRNLALRHMERGGKAVLLVAAPGQDAARAASRLLPGAAIVQGAAAIGTALSEMDAPGATLVTGDAAHRLAKGRVLGPADLTGSAAEQGSASALLRALRPHQWLKNALVFIPMLVSHQFDADTVLVSLLAFVAFSLVASSVYVLNDLLDLAADRAHPRKRSRPFASGDLPLRAGRWLVPGLLIAGLALASAVGLELVGVMMLYFAVTLLYTFWLKRRSVIDICTLAGLYTLRLVAGSAATGIPLSVWLLAFSIFVFLSLAAVKRQAELQDAISRGKTLALGRGYRAEDVGLISQMAISAGYVSVLVLALYVNSDAVRDLYSTPAALWGICLVLLYWLSRNVMKAHRGELHDDPLVFAVKDNVSRICIILMLGFGLLGAVL